MRPVRTGLGLARMCGLGIDARRVRRTRDVIELAHASRWIAANLCSIHDVSVERREVGAKMVGVRAHDLRRLFAALAATPCLVDAELLPLAWRIALRGLGVPVLDRPAEEAIEAGVAVLVPESRVLAP